MIECAVYSPEFVSGKSSHANVCADVCGQLQDAQHSLQQLQSQLQLAEEEQESLQSRLDGSIKARQEAEALCLHLGEEVRQVQGQLAGTRHSMSLFQSQQLELQVKQCSCPNA